MPDIGSMLRQEIARLSRRELRSEVRAARKASTQYRHHIAALRRQLSALERQVATLQRRVADGHRAPASASPEEGGPRLRFSAGRLRAQRTKHDFTAGEYAKLLDVSEQTIYNWERGTHRPGQDRLAVIAELRGLGKRALQARLDEKHGQASSTKSASVKERSTKKSATKKRGTKNSATKNSATKKSATKKSATKKSATKKRGTKKSATKKSATKKSATKKSATKKTVAKKSTPRSSARQ
jgi:predicted transcriptional regulator